MNLREVEIAGTRCVEVAVLWGSAILSVAHLPLDRGFCFAASLRGGRRARTTARFVVGPEVIRDAAEMPVVVPSPRGPLFIVPREARAQFKLGDLDFSLKEMIACELATPYDPLPGSYAVEIPAGGLFAMVVGGLTVQARIVARPCAVASKASRLRRDTALAGSFLAALTLVLGTIGASQLACGSNDGLISQGPRQEDRMSELVELQRRTLEKGVAGSLVESTQGEETVWHPTPPPASEGGERRAPHNTSGMQETPDHRERSMVNVGRRAWFPSVPGIAAAERVARTRSLLVSLARAEPANDFFRPRAEAFESYSRLGGTPTWGEGFLGATGWEGLGVSHVGVGAGGPGGGVAVAIQPRGVAHYHNSCCATVPEFLPRHRVPRTSRRHPHDSPVVINMDPDVIRRAVLRQLGAVRRCRDEGYPSTGGRVTIQFTVGTGGLVSTSEVEASDESVSGSVATCIAVVIRRIQFPPPPNDSPVRVSYPFLLAAHERPRSFEW